MCCDATTFLDVPTSLLFPINISRSSDSAYTAALCRLSTQERTAEQHQGPKHSVCYRIRLTSASKDQVSLWNDLA